MQRKNFDYSKLQEEFDKLLEEYKKSLDKQKVIEIIKNKLIQNSIDIKIDKNKKFNFN